MSEVALFEAFAASREAFWRPASMDREGFVHLSFAEQLAGTLTTHFADERDLVLLEIDPAALGEELLLESARAGRLFPHLYRPVGRVELLRDWPLTAGAPEALPRLAERATEDAPPGRRLRL